MSIASNRGGPATRPSRSTAATPRAAAPTIHDARRSSQETAPDRPRPTIQRRSDTPRRSSCGLALRLHLATLISHDRRTELRLILKTLHHRQMLRPLRDRNRPQHPHHITRLVDLHLLDLLRRFVLARPEHVLQLVLGEERREVKARLLIEFQL